MGDWLRELFSVEGKLALVTGGARGIGAMIARGFAQAGARVYIAARDPQRCRDAAAEIGAQPLVADLATPQGVEGLCAALRAREDRLHVLVNNAAVHWRSPLEQQVGEKWAEVWSLNVRAPFELVVGLLPLLEAGASAADPARVINIGSADGIRIPALETYAYGASKAGLHHLTRHLARRLARRHITVNAIAPGSFETEMLAPVVAEYGDKVVQAAPLRRFGRPDDAAGAALFLASRAGSYLTGAVLPLDGGMATCG
jgi:NAD(P)-dependent dehydrogenase (short-subunit alcohol dehydrogenase family)